jgi:nicotinate-nucleotide pyrophosphorylase (carboxylating)
MPFNNLVEKIIHLALDEDLGTGDVTSQAVVPADAVVKGHFIAKDNGVICGLLVAKRVFELVDEKINLVLHVKDGDKVNIGDVIAGIEGPGRGVLSGERTALNFLQRLSGIATETARLQSLISDSSMKIVDTRKTTPGLRVLEKYAVKMGGGFNHRMNLSDGILIKDNHIKAAGGIKPAIAAARQNAPQTLKIEVETETLEQVQEALDAGADIIMLDNMDNQTMREAVNLVNGKALTEASGNMDQRNLLDVAQTGVDLVSMGALTHSVKALDISLKFY